MYSASPHWGVFPHRASAEMSSQQIPPEVRDKILADPQVQAMIAKQVQATGKSAADSLQDPVVQEQIKKTVKEKFPVYAGMAADKFKEFANDPATQEAAKKYAAIAADYAKLLPAGLVSQIEQGPAGVRFLAFIGGVGSCVLACMSLLNVSNAVFAAHMYIFAIYQFVFSLTTIMFEANPEWVAKVPGLNKYQDMLCDHAKFLSEEAGRGAFYIYQGTCWLVLASLQNLGPLIIGLYMIFVGALNMLLAFGGYSHFQEKVSSQYKVLRGDSAPSASP